MSTRIRSVVALGASLVLVAVITACIPDGTAEECAGQVTTTTLVDCAWTTSTTTTTDPSAPTTSTTEAPTTTDLPTTTEEPTTTTAPATTTTTRPPGDLNDPWWAYKGNLDGPKVLVVGDSLIRLATPAINAALYPDHATQVLGMSGFKLAASDYYLAPYPASNPDVVVVEFGTNDATGIRDDTTGAKRGLEGEVPGDRGELPGHHVLRPDDDAGQAGVADLGRVQPRAQRLAPGYVSRHPRLERVRERPASRRVRPDGR